jgi:pimeloyl-ACP methyl ester carboxylesterase
MTNFRKYIPLASLLYLAAGMGCANGKQPYVTPQRLERGLVVVLTGIEGRSPLNEAICRGLDAGGVDYAIQLEDWTAPVGPLINLRNESRNRTRAREIAEQIARYQEAYYHRPVVLVGQSGGGAMAAWIAESLPREHKVDGIVMLAASLSPEYPLDNAMLKSRKGIVNFYSPHDWVFLGLGTATVGTMDGRHSVSAGAKGFELPQLPRRKSLYQRKLFQISWNEDMARLGHMGGHLSSGNARFVASYVAPLVRTGHWNDQVVDRVLAHKAVEPQFVPSDVNSGTNGYLLP